MFLFPHFSWLKLFGLTWLRATVNQPKLTLRSSINDCSRYTEALYIGMQWLLIGQLDNQRKKIETNIFLLLPMAANRNLWLTRLTLKAKYIVSFHRVHVCMCVHTYTCIHKGWHSDPLNLSFLSFVEAQEINQTACLSLTHWEVVDQFQSHRARKRINQTTRAYRLPVQRSIALTFSFFHVRWTDHLGGVRLLLHFRSRTNSFAIARFRNGEK